MLVSFFSNHFGDDQRLFDAMITVGRFRIFGAFTDQF